ncbi:MAG: hypothetical protein ACREA0_31510, partial [bacterium]
MRLRHIREVHSARSAYGNPPGDEEAILLRSSSLTPTTHAQVRGPTNAYHETFRPERRRLRTTG